jgi:hypothetical protein
MQYRHPLHYIVAMALIACATPIIAFAAFDATADLLPAEPWLRALAYIGSIGLGGYLVVWLTRTMWPQFLVSFRETMLTIVAELKEQRAETRLAHDDLFKEIRATHDVVRDCQIVHNDKTPA